MSCRTRGRGVPRCASVPFVLSADGLLMTRRIGFGRKKKEDHAVFVPGDFAPPQPLCGPGPWGGLGRWIAWWPRGPAQEFRGLPWGDRDGVEEDLGRDLRKVWLNARHEPRAACCGSAP